MTIVYRVIIFSAIIFAFNISKTAIRDHGTIGQDWLRVIKISILETVAITATGTLLFIDL